MFNLANLTTLFRMATLQLLLQSVVTAAKNVAVAFDLFSCLWQNYRQSANFSVLVFRPNNID